MVPPELQQLSVDIEPPKLTPDELTECYGWADVLLILSRWEGLPLTIIEAMRLGVVCATASGPSQKQSRTRNRISAAERRHRRNRGRGCRGLARALRRSPS